MFEKIDTALYQACFEVACRLGDDLLKMSCFVSNWRVTEPVDQDEESLVAA